MFSLVFRALRYLAMYETEAKAHSLGFCSFYDLAMVESILLRGQNVMLSAPMELGLDSLNGHCEGRQHFPLMPVAVRWHHLKRIHLRTLGL